MPRPRLDTSALMLLALAAAPSTGRGNLQVVVPRGARVILDDAPSRIAEGAHGVIFRDVAAGSHRVTVLVPGHHPRRALVEVRGEELEVLEPAPARRAETSEATGYLRLQTLPARTTVKARSLGWDQALKGAEPLAGRVPAGTHRVLVCTEQRCVPHRLTIEAGRLRSIVVDVADGRILDKSTAHAWRWNHAESECGAGNESSCAEACRWDLALLEKATPSCQRLVDRADRADRTASK